MDLVTFRDKVREYCRLVGRLQKTLAQELGLNYSVLSNKLNGTSQARLTQPEVKQIIKVLAEWEAITRQDQAVELLELMDLKYSSFQPQEWAAPPLNKLEAVAKSEKVASSLSFNSNSSGRPGRLPVFPTRLVGREKEVSQVRALLLKSGVALVTLLGPGGMGKTRLAAQVATELEGYFPDGVFYVQLSPIVDPALVASTIARTLNLKEGDRRPLSEHLKDYLRDKALLLVLDNFEQISSTAGLLGALLEEAAHLKILVTSRVVLHLNGEHVFEVPPLSLPDLNLLATEQAELPFMLAQSYAVDLFVQRARAVQPNFTLSAENAEAVAQLCIRLNGLPLAIELATSHLKAFSPQALLQRLLKGDSQSSPMLRLLTGGAQNLPARQQTLRQTLNWSYDLLEESERILFHRLAVFSGGCTLEAAEAVAGELAVRSAPSLEEAAAGALHQNPSFEVLPVLESLISKSMLRSEEGADHEYRFTMLYMLREYALERLSGSGEEEIIRQRHALYYLELAETAEPELRGSHQIHWLARLERENNNLRAALDWFLKKAVTNEIEMARYGARLGVALYRFWWLRGYLSEGCSRLEALLVYKAWISESLQARLLHGAGQLNWDMGRAEAAIAAYRESLSLFRKLNDSVGQAGVMDGLGYALSRQGEYEPALEFHRESLNLWQNLGDQRGVAVSLYNQGLIEQQRGNFAGARRLLEEGLRRFLELKDNWGIEVCLFYLVNLVEQIPDYESARTLYEENLALCRKLGDNKGTALALRVLARLAGNRGDHARATELHLESLNLFRKLGDQGGVAHSLNSLGWENLFEDQVTIAKNRFEAVLQLYIPRSNQPTDKVPVMLALLGLAILGCEQGEYRTAVYLLGASEALAASLNFPLPSSIALRREQALLATRQFLGENIFEQTWNKGLATGLAATLQVIRI
jgi:predicted ATPase